MPYLEYEVELDDEAREWLRLRITTEGADVTAFTAQYETTIGGERTPVVRYDNAHGYAHRDVLDRRGRVIDKRPVPGNPTLKEALEIGRMDLRNNWPHYRAAFFGDAP
ncbi:MAG: hypothetical protein M3Q10_11665 [Chloroflexota bacterium]|nr:hypothetical protein [Chloroflexota bacterium]